MPKLDEDRAAGVMDGIGNAPPARNLRFSINARRVDIALALLRDLRRFADDQPGAGALAVILHHEIIGNIAAAGAIARQGRHDDAVAQGQLAQFIRLE
jgi:hypothetical protein